MEVKEEELRSWKENKEYKEIEKRGNMGIPTMGIMTKKKFQKWKRKVESKVRAQRGFEERKIDGRIVAPTCLGEGLKICLSVIKREGWKVRSLDVFFSRERQ